MIKPAPSRLLVLSILATGSFAVACSGSSGGDEAFQLTRISLLEDAVWKVNQEIVFTFSDPVDFSTVSLNTINIQGNNGAPATGTFTLRAPHLVVFQPHCPTLPDGSDSGLQPGGQPYILRVPGRSSGAGNTVRALSGEALDVTQVRNFTTDSGQAAFIDTNPGPPVPLVRAQGSSALNASHLEIGNDPANRVYFERDAAQDIVLSIPNFEAPLNLYGDPATSVAFVIEFNQALDPSSTNISTDLIHLQFEDSFGDWQPLETSVVLAANCTETGARVRLEPIGVLPQATRVRAVILAGLADLVGQESAANDNFAITPTREIAFASLNPPGDMSDEFPESFDFGGNGPLSFEDTEALFETPAARWDDGELTAAFDFDGTGGPGGNFDWVVEDGETVVFDTANGVIIGADGLAVQLVDDGVVDVRNWTVHQNAEVRVQGIHPLRVLATGDVIIRGLVDVSGFDALDVVIPNRGNVTEIGGEGGPGGGEGGDANVVNSSSSVRGGFGEGPGGEQSTGGQGGETGFAPVSAPKDDRRPGGGAGGRFARNQGTLVAEPGTQGHGNAKGAEPGAQHRPAGGTLSPGPFVDGSDANDFFGTQAVGTPGNVTDLVRGELPSLWAGYGGGGGGNANPATQFPTPNWNPTSDEKGGAGGGGGGGIHIQALGKIQFGANAQIRSNGGRGALGENVIGQDHIGGNGGSGSGGHVILETGAFIDFTDGGVAPTSGNRDWIAALGGAKVEGAPTTPANLSVGGAGGPGVIQLHVPRSLTLPSSTLGLSDIIVPSGITGDPINAVTSPQAEVLIPTFAARSQARSRWISLGKAEERGTGVPSLVRFLFQGTSTTPGADEGKVLVTFDEEVQELAPLLDEDLEGNPNVVVLPDRITLQISGASLAPFGNPLPNGLSSDLYLRNPALLEDFILRLSVGAVAQEFTVARAVYDESGPIARLSLTVVDSGIDLQDFITANTALGTIHYELVPRFFLISTGGVEDALPSNAFVRILFEGAADDGTGAPALPPLVPWTGDISQFNLLPAGELQFFRFAVEFDLAGGGAVSAETEPVSLDFLRIPFVF